MNARDTNPRRYARVPVLILLAGVLALCLSGAASAAQVRAWLDRGSMQLGETVTRLPEHTRYVPPTPVVLSEAAQRPLIRLNAFEASATAKVFRAVMAFQQSLFRDAPNAG